jgi:hypothetical protein
LPYICFANSQASLKDSPGTAGDLESGGTISLFMYFQKRFVAAATPGSGDERSEIVGAYLY